MLTKKSYEMLATVIRQTHLETKNTQLSPEMVIDRLIENLSVELKNDNYRFSASRFNDACFKD